MLAFQYIKDQQSLQNLVSEYQRSELLVLDTEFVRTRTYYAKLGLIQAYNGKTLALIDPCAINDLTPFWALLKNSNITKIIHSCGEDLEVFSHYGLCQPFPLFDSQIAASLSGMGHGLGYAKLVEICLQVTLDKGESRTDWLKRPLTSAQLSYAANDVYYLYQLYPILKNALEQKQRLPWLFSEGKRLTDARENQLNFDLAYLKVKNANQLSTVELAYLKVLAKWRMKKAIDKDLALGFVIKDHGLVAIAKKQPSNTASLLRLTELTEQEKRLYSIEIIQVLKTADLTNLPEAIDILVFRTGYKQAFKEVKNALVTICDQHDIPTEMLASKRLIHEYLQWFWDNKQGLQPVIISDWRKEFTAVVLDGLNLEFQAKG